MREFLKANASETERARFLDVARSARATAREEPGRRRRRRRRPHRAAPGVRGHRARRGVRASGFLIYLPFLVIDLVVSNLLLALGMQMMSPTQVSLPFKLLLFVAIDGWGLLARSLVERVPVSAGAERSSTAPSGEVGLTSEGPGVSSGPSRGRARLSRVPGDVVFGAIAQLGERCVRNAEVRGSIPRCSTLLRWGAPARVPGIAGSRRHRCPARARGHGPRRPDLRSRGQRPRPWPSPDLEKPQAGDRAHGRHPTRRSHEQATGPMAVTRPGEATGRRPFPWPSRPAAVPRPRSMKSHGAAAPAAPAEGGADWQPRVHGAADPA